jgi:hypothetical protein
MLSESATVAPLNPVPVGVCASFDCEFERGMLRRDRFFLGSPVGAAPLSPASELADAGPFDDDRGTTMLTAGDARATMRKVSNWDVTCSVPTGSRGVLGTYRFRLAALLCCRWPASQRTAGWGRQQLAESAWSSWLSDGSLARMRLGWSLMFSMTVAPYVIARRLPRGQRQSDRRRAATSEWSRALASERRVRWSDSYRGCEGAVDEEKCLTGPRARAKVVVGRG